AEGQTNREVAQALFVTEKTVERHLSSAYQKLGIRSRFQLVSAIGGEPTPCAVREKGRGKARGASPLTRHAPRGRSGEARASAGGRPAVGKEGPPLRRHVH